MRVLIAVIVLEIAKPLATPSCLPFCWALPVHTRFQNSHWIHCQCSFCPHLFYSNICVQLLYFTDSMICTASYFDISEIEIHLKLVVCHNLLGLLSFLPSLFPGTPINRATDGILDLLGYCMWEP